MFHILGQLSVTLAHKQTSTFSQGSASELLYTADGTHAFPDNFSSPQELETSFTFNAGLYSDIFLARNPSLDLPLKHINTSPLRLHSPSPWPRSNASGNDARNDAEAGKLVRARIPHTWVVFTRRKTKGVSDSTFLVLSTAWYAVITPRVPSAPP